MADDEKGDEKGVPTDNDFVAVSFTKGDGYYLEQNHFKIIHVSNHDGYSPTDKYLNTALQITNENYTLHTVKDRANLSKDVFNEFDTILLSIWSSVNEEVLGNLVANAVDNGKNVVILLFSNTLSFQHPKGRFMSGKYNATTRVSNQTIDSSLGQVYNTEHPIMTNVRNITLGSEKRHSMGKIPDNEQEHIDRIADWKDGNVFIAIRHNKPALITEITCSFGENGAKSDGPQLINNALRLKKRKYLMAPRRLINIISNSNFRALQHVQQQFTSNDMNALQNNCNFNGWDQIYDDISNEFGKILATKLDIVSKQIQTGTQKQIDILTVQNNKLLQKVESSKKELEELGVPQATIEESVAPLLKHSKILEAEQNKWKHSQINTNKIINSTK